MNPIKGKVNKAVGGYMTIMSKDPELQNLRGKTVTFQITAIEETIEKPGATITETKLVI